MKKFFLCVAAVASFWGIVLLGPFLLGLAVRLAEWWDGLVTGSGALLYDRIIYFSQPVCVFIAYFVAKQLCFKAAENVSEKPFKKTLIANCILLTCIAMLLSLQWNGLDNRISMLATTGCGVACIVMAFLNSDKFETKDNSE